MISGVELAVKNIESNPSRLIFGGSGPAAPAAAPVQKKKQ
jgi:hypothetical protein